MRKPPKGKSLAEVNPELAKEWHPTKNGDLTPFDFTYGSKVKVWWKCREQQDHEWEAFIYDRSGGKGCPFCSGKLVSDSNCLKNTIPKLAKEWHPTKNGNLTPFDVTSGSGKKVWWKCPKGEDHEWEAKISNRAHGAGCPVCAGRLIVKSNSLATLNPTLAKDWHPTKNGNLTPSDVGISMGKKVWWKCPKGEDHEWQDSLNHRSSGRGCPFCSSHRVSISNSLATLNPKIATEWHPNKNGALTPQKIMPGSTKRVWWKCPKGVDHEWEASPNTRTNGYGCPICSGHKVVKSNSLSNSYPEVSEEWHPTKNGNLTPEDVTSGTGKKVWWKCPKGDDHVWKTSVVSRTSKGGGCPICSGQKLVKSNSLETLYPEVIKLWHPTKNFGVTPSDFTAGTRKKVWWKCPKGEDHEWEASIVHIVKGGGCPVCRGLKVVKSNSLATLKPQIASQWHPSKNGRLTPNDVSLASHKVVWWQCSKNPTHEWRSIISNRTTKGRSCPFCTLTPQSRQELQITFELKQFFEINPKGFKTRVQGKLWSIDIYLKELNLGIEFDGSYWHKDKRDLDKLKTEKLHEEGFTIMRIREEPLKPITDIDVVSALPFNGKKVTNDILKHILEVYDIDSKRVKKMKEYFRKRTLQNEANLDAYIDQILEEKAERKRKRK